MAERKPLSKRTRFEIFKRDGFCCIYCNRNPPSVTLQVDHIIPVSKNGTNRMDNLVTACFDCNSGKSNIELSDIPRTAPDRNPELVREKMDQYKAYQNWMQKMESLIQLDIQKVEDALKMTYPDAEFPDSFKNSSIRNFIEKLGVADVVISIHRACDKNIYGNISNTFKYFCGICWNKIKKRYPEYDQQREVNNG